MAHHAHCMFIHRHEYKYITAWASDEFLLLRQPSDSLPALLERVFSSSPLAAAVAFHRWAFRDDCGTPDDAQPGSIKIAAWLLGYEYADEVGCELLMWSVAAWPTVLSVSPAIHHLYTQSGQHTA